MHSFRVLTLLATVALFRCAAALAQPSAGQPTVLVMSSSEDAGGTTQNDLDLPVLKMLEARSVSTLKAKMQAYLKARGQSAELPPFQSESHYVQSGAVKLAVVRVRIPGSLNQAFIYGVRGSEFHRVACARSANFEESIPLFYGPCGERIQQVFGVSIPPR